MLLVLFASTSRATNARLHPNLQKNPCGDFAEDSFRVKQKFRESSATRAAPNAAAPRGDQRAARLRFPPAANKKKDEPQSPSVFIYFFNSSVKANAVPCSVSSSRIRCPCISKMR